MKIIRKLFFVFIVLNLTNLLLADKFLKPQGNVSDFANVINEKLRQQINAIVVELEQKTSAEIAVVTVKNLNGESIETYSVDLFKEWAIGKKGKDNGILILAAIEDKKIRIEVGYGLEGILPDGKCGAILDSYIIPEFKNSEYGRGLTLGTLAVASVIAKDAGVELTGAKLSRKSSSGKKSLNLILFLIFLIFTILNSFSRRRRYYGGGGWYGGGGHSGGGFSGGFGGFGGGMSGGGGSSRSW